MKKNHIPAEAKPNQVSHILLMSMILTTVPFESLRPGGGQGTSWTKGNFGPSVRGQLPKSSHSPEKKTFLDHGPKKINYS